MASNVFVIDSSFKRTQIRVTPAKPLREVLEEACKSRRINPEEYTLKTQTNKAIDLSQPWRLSGLSAGAKLQLIQASRSPGVVNVALQLPESEGGLRQQDKFPSTTSLWMVLRKFEDAVAGASGKKLNLTQRAVPSNNSGAGRLMFEQPVLNLMGRSLESFSDLQKTLAQLGLNGGSSLLRVTFKDSGKPLDEAMLEIGQYFKAVEQASAAGAESSTKHESSGAHAGADGNLASLPNSSAENAAAPSDSSGPEPSDDVTMTDVIAKPQQEDDDVIASSTLTESSGSAGVLEQPVPALAAPGTATNGIQVYRPPSSSTPAAASLDAEDAGNFEPTIDHAKAYQAALVQRGKNQRLLSDKEAEEQVQARQQKLASVQEVTVRIRYPDQSIVETTCYAAETCADLYTKVRQTLASSNEPFELRHAAAGGRHETVPDASSKRLVRDLGFRGRVLVTFLWTDSTSMKARSGPSLKEEYRARAQELKVELATQRDESAAAPAPAPKQDQGNKGRTGGSKIDVEAKMKKFLGFGKK